MGAILHNMIDYTRLHVYASMRPHVCLCVCATGGTKYGRTNHFVPYNTGEKELFPGKWKAKAVAVLIAA